MVTNFTRPAIFTILLIVVFNSVQAAPPQYIQFKPSATKGALYLPDPVQFPDAHIAVILMHRDSNFLSHIATREMSKRGLVVLAMNPRCDNNEAMCAPWENNALDVKQGMEYLRKLPGITQVVLFGHSGGGPTMSFYQAVAEAGVSFCQQPQKLMKCSDSLAGLPLADAVILWDSHPGNGVNAVRSINPAVTNDIDIIDKNATPKIDNSLDPFNEKNGYNPDGESHYSNTFKEKYFKAQSARMNGLIDIAQAKLKQIDAGTYGYPDDDVFIVPRGNASRLYSMDLSIENSSTKPAMLLKNDGSIVDCCIVNSVRVAGQSPESNKKFWGGTMFLSLKSFLSVRSIRSSNSIYGIDWCSSNNSAPCSLQKVSVPLLVVAMGGYFFIHDGEIIYDMATSKDKEFIVVEGATHGGTPCKICMPAGQPYDGRYDNAVKNNFDYMAKWISDRF
ncbi:MAG: hypothetical protein ACI9XC_000956 [Gammaproteobacteria bacterium]|jgi:hypothetical protein